ncbi:hypothetical protein, partial [Flagellimonas olearia]|uniref:hypothetical protein n=1 Tax=Flagellimonas olearia TaxID=552546 RepID=UPI001B886352
VIWYNPYAPQESWSDDEEDQVAAQEDAVNPAPVIAPVEINHVEPQGEDEEEDLAPMPDLEEYARILQHLALEQEQDHANEPPRNPEHEVPEENQVHSPSTPENGESCWIDNPLTSEDESDSEQATSPTRASCNVIYQGYSSSEASSDEITYTPTTPSNVSSGATSSHVTFTEMTPSQVSSPETVTSGYTFFPTDHHEENPDNDTWDDEIVNTEERLLDAVQDLLPENAPCNTVT